MPDTANGWAGESGILDELPDECKVANDAAQFSRTNCLQYSNLRPSIVVSRTM
jgi:hypothetical protein